MQLRSLRIVNGKGESPQDALLPSAPHADAYPAMYMLSAAVLTTCLTLARDIPATQALYSDVAVHALVEGFGALLTLGVVYCLWIQYSVTAERRILFAIIAMSGLLSVQVMHGLVPEVSLRSQLLTERAACIYSVGWRFAAACLLAVAAFDRTLEERHNVQRTGIRTILSSLLLGLCAAICLPLIASQQVATRELLPGLTAAAFGKLKALVVSGMLPSWMILAAGAFALYTCARAYVEREDAFTKSLTRFLFLLLLSQVALMVSAGEHNVIWWLHHLLSICAFLLLVVYLAKEFGASYADASSRIAHLEAVHYISSSLTNTLDLSVVLLATVSDTAKMLSARFASIMLADEDGKTLTTRVAYGLPEEHVRAAKPQSVEGNGYPGFHTGHVAKAFREKRIVVVDDVYTDVDFVPWRLLAEYDGYAVSVPLVYQDEAIGVLNLFFEKHVSLNDEKLRLFRTLASASAVAIANAQLYEKTIQCQGATAGEYLRFQQLRDVA